jgi:hypothetical protein
MMRTVPIEDWDLTALTDLERRDRLHGDVSPEELLNRVSIEAVIEKLQCEDGRDSAKGFWRIKARIPTGSDIDTFDLFYNGRMGYRAQYFLSVAEGRAFNDAIIDRFRPTVKAAAYQLSNATSAAAPPPECAPGLAAPRPAGIELKGTWVDPQTGEYYLPPSKRERHETIHRTGWT